jgi:peptide-methionine (S)-S-oxide reductase
MVEISDPIFADAIAAIDAGDVSRLDLLIAQHPRLVTDRLTTGEQDGYFADPYLLWFIAENPIRIGRLAPNIVNVAEVIVRHLNQQNPASRQHQLDYAIMLVATGLAPRESGVQLALIDALTSWGGIPSGLDGAIAHGEDEAARRLIHHGADVTLPAALALGLDEKVSELLPQADIDARADALVVAASRNMTQATQTLLAAGADPNMRSRHIHRHSTALHQAALRGYLEICEMLLDAGALRAARDDIWNGTPAGWAEHGGHHDLAVLLRAND